MRGPNIQLTRNKQHFSFHMNILVGPPTPLRQGQRKFNVLCTKRQDQQFTKARHFPSFPPCQAEGFRQFSQKGLDSLNALCSLSGPFVAYHLGGIIANVPKPLSMQSWNSSFQTSKREHLTAGVNTHTQTPPRKQRAVTVSCWQHCLYLKLLLHPPTPHFISVTYLVLTQTHGQEGESPAGGSSPLATDCFPKQEQFFLFSALWLSSITFSVVVMSSTSWLPWLTLNLQCQSEMLASTDTGCTFSREKLVFHHQITNPRLDTAGICLHRQKHWCF